MSDPENSGLTPATTIHSHQSARDVARQADRLPTGASPRLVFIDLKTRARVHFNPVGPGHKKSPSL